ncbi:MAG TPA: PAS domain-containing protein, partial [Syntrophales bacterium]|nr:PAS domain-containing protein [Syntrophales bacterium]
MARGEGNRAKRTGRGRADAGLDPAVAASRLRAMIDAFDGFIYICSRDYRVEYMNERLIERTGYDGTG